MIIWLKVSHDKYELPLAVADTAEELAKICGTTKNNIASEASKYDKGVMPFTKYRRIEVTDEEYTVEDKICDLKEKALYCKTEYNKIRDNHNYTRKQKDYFLQNYENSMQLIEWLQELVELRKEVGK